ncbi:MAG: NosD domain-containing protein [archaeon]
MNKRGKNLLLVSVVIAVFLVFLVAFSLAIGTDVDEGTVVNITVEGVNCSGNMIYFNYSEIDLTGANDSINPQPLGLPTSAIFTGNKTVVEWTAQWFDDSDGDDGNNNPDLQFNASCQDDSILSNIIQINPSSSSCTVPYDNMDVYGDTTLCPGSYYLNDSDANGIIRVRNGSVTLTCAGTHIYGDADIPAGSMGIVMGTSDLTYLSDITVKGCNVSNYYYGIRANGPPFPSRTIYNLVLRNNTLNNNHYEIYLRNVVDGLIENNSLNGPGIQYDAGFAFLNVNTTTVKNNILTNTHFVIFSPSYNNLILDNLFQNFNGAATSTVNPGCNGDRIVNNTFRNTWGINIEYPLNTVIEGNFVEGSSYNCIATANPSFLTSSISILNNDLKDCGTSGISINFVNNTLVSGNNITGCNLGIWGDRSFNLKILGNNFLRNRNGGSPKAIRLARCGGTIIQGNNITDEIESIVVEDSSNMSILNNNIYSSLSSSYGIFYDTSGESLIQGNNIQLTSSGYGGIWLHPGSLGCNNNVMKNNYISGAGFGVYIWLSNNNTIEDNVIDSCFASFSDGTGINVETSSNNTFVRNNVTKNVAGIKLLYTSEDNSITDSVVCNNSLSYDVVASGSSLNNSGSDNYCQNTLNWSDNGALALNLGCDNLCYPIDCDFDNDGYDAANATCLGTDCDDDEFFTNPSATEICSDVIDNNCNNESDYDEVGGLHGDLNCPVQVLGISTSNLNPIENTNIQVNCTANPGDVNSIDVDVGGSLCSFDLWDGNIASFTCNVGLAGIKDVTCSVNHLKSYQAGVNQSTTLNVIASSCSGLTEGSCNFNPSCDWCPGCSGNQSNLIGSDACVDTGTCNYECSLTFGCSAQCDLTLGGCSDTICEDYCVGEDLYLRDDVVNDCQLGGCTCEENACLTGSQTSCGSTNCNALIHLVGSCQNPCLTQAGDDVCAGSCTPSCSCEVGWWDINGLPVDGCEYACSISNGGVEILCDGIDQDCDGSDDEGTDVDGDGFKVEGGLCGLVDCDDGNEFVNPSATEICDGIDNDCNASTGDGSGEAAPLNSLQDGVCSGSLQSCTGSWTDDYLGVANYELLEVSCVDVLDNDCDGEADNNDSDCPIVLPPGAFSLFIEAEDFTLNSSIFNVNASSGASRGDYIYADGDLSEKVNPTEDGNYSVSIPADGVYALWARLYATNESNDAIYIGFDGTYNRTFPSNWSVFQWVFVASFSLTEGSHEIFISYSENLSGVDALFITENLSYIPTDDIIEYCPNTICDTARGESCSTCPADCGVCSDDDSDDDSGGGGGGGGGGGFPPVTGNETNTTQPAQNVTLPEGLECQPGACSSELQMYCSDDGLWHDELYCDNCEDGICEEEVPKDYNIQILIGVIVGILVLIVAISIVLIKAKKPKVKLSSSKYEDTLRPYVKKAVEKGMKKADIRKQLIDKKWPKEIVDKVLRDVR